MDTQDLVDRLLAAWRALLLCAAVLMPSPRPASGTYTVPTLGELGAGRSQGVSLELVQNGDACKLLGQSPQQVVGPRSGKGCSTRSMSSARHLPPRAGWSSSTLHLSCRNFSTNVTPAKSPRLPPSGHSSSDCSCVWKHGRSALL